MTYRKKAPNNADKRTWETYMCHFKPNGQPLLVRHFNDNTADYIEVSIGLMAKALQDVNLCHSLFKNRKPKTYDINNMTNI